MSSQNITLTPALSPLLFVLLTLSAPFVLQASAVCPSSGEVVSEGVALSGASALHAEGVCGRGVRIAVIDGHFGKYERSRAGGELGLGTMCYRCDANSCSLCDPVVTSDSNEHGTQVAEIVQDIAPGAEVVLIRLEDPADVRHLQQAVAFCRMWGVRVISSSLSFIGYSFSDGQGNVEEVVKSAAESGILWVTSVGNFGRRHYQGVFTDTDRDGFHEFLKIADGPLAGLPGEGIPVALPPGVRLKGILTWDDWSSTRANKVADYEFQVRRVSDSDPTITMVQSGVSQYFGSVVGRDAPMRIMSFETGRRPCALYQVGIRRSNRNAQPRMKLFLEASVVDEETFRDWRLVTGLFSEAASQCRDFLNEALIYRCPECQVATGSLGDLAASPHTLTVSGVDYESRRIDLNSSEGPSNHPDPDLQRKPDLAAYTNVATSTGRLGQSSGAAPHVAGAAALLLESEPDLAVDEIKRRLTRRQEGATHRTDVGWGVLQLPARAQP